MIKTAIVLASGPSLSLEQIDAARKSGHFTIVVNRTYQSMLDANVVYMGDFLSIKVYNADVVKTFQGAKWTQDSSAAARWPHWKRVKGANREGLGRDMIHQLGNSGFQAINLAYLWGYKRIILLGFDMQKGPNGELHHHADHPAPLVQGVLFKEWLFKSVKLAKDLKGEGVEVLNCTPGSAMTTFPKADWHEVLTP